MTNRRFASASSYHRYTFPSPSLPYHPFPPLPVSQVLATVSPATTSMMSFLNTSSSIVHYMTLGEVSYPYAAWGFGIGAAGGR